MKVLPIEVDLTDGQLNKFKKLFNSISLCNHKAYFLAREMHGVLLTNSRQSAMNIITSHLRFIQPYIETFDRDMYIKHIGVDILLDKMSEENPKKRVQYLAVRAYISAQLANDSNIFRDAVFEAIQIDRKRIQAMQWVRARVEKCELSGVSSKDVEIDIHHIEGVSEQPDLATDVKNLIPLDKKIHKEYHAWAIKEGQPVTRASLKQFAKKHGYSTNWSMIWLQNDPTLEDGTELTDPVQSEAVAVS